ncbi:MAG: thiamine phosphate synthase [Candidatus Cybelea sp.]|jgi:thiamine-phosphate diphosphorylase
MATNAAARVTRRQRAELLRDIYVIVNEDARAIELAQAVLTAGVRILQYRAKTGLSGDRLRALRALTRERDALLIMNDNWRAAVEFDCDGVHLGPDDAGFDRVASVRAMLPERLIGLSSGTIAEAKAAGDADYLGVGSIFATGSKNDAGEPIGLDGLQAIAACTLLPIAAVGGLTAARLPEVRRSGAAMAAVISAVAGAPAPGCAARELIEAWQQ